MLREAKTVANRTYAVYPSNTVHCFVHSMNLKHTCLNSNPK